MATTNAYVSYFEQPAFQTHWRVIAQVWAFASDATSANLVAGAAILEADKDVPRNVQTAVAGWFVHLSSGAVTARLPGNNSVEAQRAEIKDIIREQFALFNILHFDNERIQIVRKYVRNCLAYTGVATSNNDLDKCKEVARTNLNDLALYATSAWGTTLDTAGLRLFALPEPLTPNTAAPPAEETLTATRTAQQLTGTNLAEELA